ncbi:MAG: Asp-tRNA(Asn)/Glu-tRNA(Gln) amidotransferase subunit GatB [Chloroflexi bacterium]|nr:Asp-tRNA(Asn)/Glu-tRNA(Gln) amidotransferase subunit GatB [Chloroflexota bacterium]
MEFEPVIGLEVHAELQTKSKMFCGCPVVDSTQAAPNTAVCPVCAGMPGALPVANRQAVEYGMRVALALECKIEPISIFARKNYFYPDLPKGYQISQYEEPLATNGRLVVHTAEGEQTVRVRRVHLEEDAGKLTHVNEGDPHTLVDLNRAGVPLLEIVSEPDMHSVEAARAYAETLREIVRYLGVNSGDMEKGVIRFEANISVRPKTGAGSEPAPYGTRTEVKNLNSFRAMEEAIRFEIARQSEILEAGGTVEQETLGWDEVHGTTYSQRSKEDAHDYRYFPEPDLPPLIVEDAWVEKVRAELPELPMAKRRRFTEQYGLSAYDANLLVAERAVADYFERTVAAAGSVPAKSAANWVTGELFALMKQAGVTVEALRVSPSALAGLVTMVSRGEINQNTGKDVLAEMFESGRDAAEIVEARGLRQVSDETLIADLVKQVLDENPAEVSSYRSGKTGLANWLFGQVMKKARGRANPQVVRQELERQLED